MSRDLSRCSRVDSIPTLQALLDNWEDQVSVVEDLYSKLNNDSFGDNFASQSLRAPLPRAYEWVDGSAY